MQVKKRVLSVLVLLTMLLNGCVVQLQRESLPGESPTPAPTQQAQATPSPSPEPTPSPEEEFARLAPTTQMSFEELVGDNGIYEEPESYPPADCLLYASTPTRPSPSQMRRLWKLPVPVAVRTG